MSLRRSDLIDQHVLESALVDWLSGEAAGRAPEGLSEQILRATAPLPQRSPWLGLPGLRLRPRWLPRTLAGAAAAGVVLLALGAFLTWSGPPLPGGPLVQAGTMAHPRTEHTATLLPNGQVLVVGGSQRHGSSIGDVVHVSVAELWDPATMSFASAGELLQARARHTATALPDGRVLIVGGQRVEATGRDGQYVQLAAAEIWDPMTESFSPAGELPQARAGHTATLLPDGRVLIVGGSVGFNSPRGLASIVIWDPEKSNFSAAGELSQPRSGHTATPLFDGRVLIAGGSSSGTSEAVLSSTELWDTATSLSSPGPSMSEARFSASAVPLDDGPVLIIGGGRQFLPPSAELWDAATGQFSPAGTIGREEVLSFDWTAAPLRDGRVVVFGPYGAVELWDPETLDFTAAGALDSRHGLTATALADGRVLIVGGYAHFVNYSETLASALLYDAAAEPAAPGSRTNPPGAGSFSSAALLPEPRELSSAMRLQDGRILLYGGSVDQAAGECAELRGPPLHVWDPSSQVFDQLPGLPEPREGHSLVPLTGGRFLVVGGYRYRSSGQNCLREPTRSVTLWDPLAGSASPAGSLSELRIMPSGLELADGRVLVVGGSAPETDGQGHESLDSAEVWDPATRSFRSAGRLAQPRSSASTTLLEDGRVLVVGGMAESWECDAGGSCIALRPGLETAEVWVPSTGAFLSIGAMSVARTGHTATLLTDGRVLVIGGRRNNESWGPDHLDAEVWNPATSTFSPAGSLPQPQPMHSATLLSNGRVLVVGEAQALLWDPATSLFGEDGWLIQPRRGHSATLLVDGRVLVAGGTSAQLEPVSLDSVEIYTPAQR